MQHIFSFALIFLQQFSLPISFWHPFGLQFAWSNKNDGLTLSCVHKNLSSLMQYHLGLQFAWPNSLLPDAQGNWRSDSNLCFLKTCKVDLVILHSTLPLMCCMSLTRLYLYHLSIEITLGPDTWHKTHKTWKVELHSTLSSYTCLITFIGTLKQSNWNALRRLQFVWNCDIHDEIGSHRASFSENKFGVQGQDFTSAYSSRSH